MKEVSCPHCYHLNPPKAKFCQECGRRVKIPKDPLVGREVGNHRLVRRIGVGGMGVVYEAEHTNLGKRYAVKFLHPQFSADEEVVERFRREARVIASLEHENIIRETDFGWLDGVGFYLIMEFLEGRTLKDVIREEGALSLPRVKRLFDQILDALIEAHSKEVVHRDLKPENLFLIERRGRELVKILDFGIARIAYSQEEKENKQEFTIDGEVYGSPTYMSPEQARGEISLVDRRSDLYSVGAILVEALTGRPPFQGNSPAEVMLSHITNPAPSLAELRSDLSFPPALERIVQKALAKEKEERFSTAREFRDELYEVEARSKRGLGFEEMEMTVNEPVVEPEEEPVAEPPDTPPSTTPFPPGPPPPPAKDNKPTTTSAALSPDKPTSAPSTATATAETSNWPPHAPPENDSSFPHANSPTPPPPPSDFWEAKTGEHRLPTSQPSMPKASTPPPVPPQALGTSAPDKPTTELSTASLFQDPASMHPGTPAKSQTPWSSQQAAKAPEETPYPVRPHTSFLDQEEDDSWEEEDATEYQLPRVNATVPQMLAAPDSPEAYNLPTSTGFNDINTDAFNIPTDPGADSTPGASPFPPKLTPPATTPMPMLPSLAPPDAKVETAPPPLGDPLGDTLGTQLPKDSPLLGTQEQDKPKNIFEQAFGPRLGKPPIVISIFVAAIVCITLVIWAVLPKQKDPNAIVPPVPTIPSDGTNTPTKQPRRKQVRARTRRAPPQRRTKTSQSITNTKVMIRLHIKTTPPGAKVYLLGHRDGYMATTPCTLSFVQGANVSLEVRHKGYRSQIIKWTANEHSRVQFSLFKED